MFNSGRDLEVLATPFGAQKHGQQGGRRGIGQAGGGKPGSWALVVVVMLAVAGLPAAVWAQTVGGEAAASALTGTAAGAGAELSLVRWNGSLPQESGRTVMVNFSLFQDQAGGLALWSETQAVKVGADGRYSVLLGAMSAEGLPQGLFQGGEARWVEARPVNGNGEAAAKTARSLLAAVPYAFKAVDAETLAGRPAADYVTREDLPSAVAASVLEAVKPSPETSPTVTGSGTTNYLPVWTGTSTLGNSIIAESGTKVGIGTIAPQTTIHVVGTSTLAGNVSIPAPAAATATTAQDSPQLELAASTYSSTSSAAVGQKFAWRAISAGNDTAAPTANLEFLFGSGTAAPTATGLAIAPNGKITFATGQTFPGTGAGTITGVTATSPVTASTTGGAVSLGLNTGALETTLNGVYPQLGAANTFAKPITFAAGQAFPGTIASVSATSPLTANTTSGAVSLGLNAATLETTLGGVYAQLATNNHFTLGASFGAAVSASASSGNALTGTGTKGAYGVAGISDTGNAGNFSSGAAPAATIYSTNSAAFDGSSIPVALNGTSTGTTSVGIYGSGTLSGTLGISSALGAWGNSGGFNGLTPVTGAGVLGTSTTPTAGQAGVIGNTANALSTTYAYEVARGGVAGVWGDSTGNPISTDYSAGVVGTSEATDGYGGVFINNSAAGLAIYGKNLGSGGGVYGTSTGSGTAATGGTGVNGFTPTPAAGQAGVLGTAYQTSATFATVMALGPVGFVAGVWGDAGEVNDGTETYEAGVVGTGDDITAGIFENNSSQHPTIDIVNNSSGGTGLFKTLMASSPDGACGFGDGGNLACTGQMKSLVTTGGARKVETYAMQSPENWMEDFGSGALERGVAVVTIDPAFAETVTADASYHVFITPNADSRGLYVIRKTATSFEVRESGGGTSSLSFDYRIVAKRRGYEAQRLTDVTERFVAERNAAVPAARAAVAPHSEGPRLSSPGGPAVEGAPRVTPRNPSTAVRVGAGRRAEAARPELIERH